MTHLSYVTFYVYKLVNKTTGKTYTGVTGRYNVRIWTHFNCLKRNAHYNTALQEDYNKGHEFEAKIITTANARERFSREAENIDSNTYNERLPFYKRNQILEETEKTAA